MGSRAARIIDEVFLDRFRRRTPIPVKSPGNRAVDLTPGEQPKQVEMSPQELEIATSQPFLAYSKATEIGHHPSLWDAVKGTVYEGPYRRDVLKGRQPFV